MPLKSCVAGQSYSSDLIESDVCFFLFLSFRLVASTIKAQNFNHKILRNLVPSTNPLSNSLMYLIRAVLPNEKHNLRGFFFLVEQKVRLFFQI